MKRKDPPQKTQFFPSYFDLLELLLAILILVGAVFYVYRNTENENSPAEEKTAPTAREANAALIEHSIEPTAAEWPLVLALGRFPSRVEQAALAYDPSLFADYSYDLAKAINDFYETEPVLKAEPALRAWRLKLLRNAELMLGRCLDLMGIPALEEM